MSARARPSAETLVATFIDAVTRLNRSNAHDPDWWLTWLSARDRFRSRFFDALRADALSDRPMPRAGAGDLVRLAKAARLWLSRIAAARRHPLPADAPPADVLIVTILTERAVAAPGPYRDVYFGQLHEALAANGAVALHVGFTEGDAYAITRAAAARHDVRIATLAHALTRRDVIEACIAALRFRFVVPDLPLPWGGDAGRLVRLDLGAERLSVLEGRLVRAAMRRFLERHPHARLVHMYESNGWERASYMEAAEAQPPRPVTGYLHCAVLKSHMKNVLPEGELTIRPMPDRIATTGPAAAALLARLGSYPPGMIAAGCGLRPPLPAEIPPMPEPRRPARTVLLLLEGLVSAIPGFRMFAEAAARRPDLRFGVRCHPQLPADRLGRLAGIAITEAGPVRPSVPATLDAAVAEADLVVYISSTSVLTAVHGGRPTIRLDVDHVLDDDPLTEMPHHKRVVRDVDGLLAAIEAVDALDDATFREEAEHARRYVHDYIAPADEHGLAPFLLPPPPLPRTLARMQAP